MIRKAFVGSLAGGAIGASAIAARAARSALFHGRDVPGPTFTEWIVAHQVTANGLCRYYRFGPHAREESPLAPAYAILHLVDKEPGVARKLGNGLIALQASSSGNRRCSGGVPSIANDDSRLYYASDALACAEAQIALYRATHRDRYLVSARRFIAFVRSMSDGVGAGMFVENVGLPMQFVSWAGDYQNDVVLDGVLLFWHALLSFAKLAGDSAARDLYERGRRFVLAKVQAPSGAFYDHYDPGYPPLPYADSRWRFYKTEPDGRRIAVGDSMLMAALGVQRLGGEAMVERFFRFLQPTNGAVYAYVDAATGGPGFAAGDKPYFDIVDSALYGVLLHRAGSADEEQIAALRAVVKRARTKDGGYRWGRHVDGTWVQDEAEALVTGFWAQRLLEAS